MKHAIVGTAGHIDHGKTKLIEALTGIDCDRWAEEKRRGITIDLGFAHLDSAEIQIGFIDVPGHQRFVDNALAGLGGIRVMLLVVAADEGVMPQTREHLAICSLLGIRTGIVALTKTDLVTPDLVALVELEVEELLAETPFAGAPALPVSALSREGIAELRESLVALAAAASSEAGRERPARLPIDRVFGLKGLGLVVTGTLAAGEIRPGDELTTLPGAHRARVRSVQVHGQDRERARCGERTALRLTGLDAAVVARGAQLIAPDGYAASKRLLARLELLPEASPITAPLATRLHVYSDDVAARVYPLAAAGVEPGSTAIVEVRATRPIVAARGDRFIIRRPSPPATLGGGEILDPFWARPRKRHLAAALAAAGGDDPGALTSWLGAAGPAGLGVEATARRLGVAAEAAERQLRELASAGLAVEAAARGERSPRFIAPSGFAAVARRAKQVLADYFERDRLAESMSKAEAMRRILPTGAMALADFYCKWLAAEGILVLDSERVTLPGRTADLSGEESALEARLLSLFEAAGLTPPGPEEIGRQAGGKPQITAGVVTHLLRRGRLVRLPGGLIVAAAAIEDLRRNLAASGWTGFTIAEFKSRFDISRKWAIPLLEYLDSIGFTRRIGDRRQIVGASLPPKETE